MRATPLTLAAATTLVAFGDSAAAADFPEGFTQLVREQAPAVVGVLADRPTPAGPARPQLPPGLREFFGPRGPMGPERPQRRGTALGSGFIISEEGHVVTNNHVVAGADAVRVAMADGRELDAEILGVDPATDLALLDIAGDGFDGVAWGDSDAVEIGSWVVAIGNPFGLGGSVTAGILSARSRDINAGPYDDFLQTDASINRGNSGGPLFSADGAVIGVNTAILSPTGGNVGIGFAVPANVAKRVVASLREDGVVRRGWLGVQLQPLDEDLAAALGLEDAAGALIAEVTDGAPADEAGLRAGDVVRAFGGEAVADPRALALAVATTDPGETVAMVVRREGGERTLDVAVGQQPGRTPAPAAAEDPPQDAPLGVGVAALTDELRRSLGAPGAIEGLAVTTVRPDSPADAAGVRRGDVIVAAGGAPTLDAETLRGAVAVAREREQSLLLRVWRDSGFAFLAAPVGQG